VEVRSLGLPTGHCDEQLSGRSCTGDFDGNFWSLGCWNVSSKGLANCLYTYSSRAGGSTEERKEIDHHIKSYNADYYSTTPTWQPDSRVLVTLHR